MTGQNKGLLITGTDQGVGCTSVTAALARIVARAGFETGVMLPVETNVKVPEQLGTAGRLLQWAAQSGLEDDQICPYRFQAQVEPATAASKKNVRIDFNSLVENAKQMISTHDFTLIDGSGGIMLPLAGGLLMSDFAAMLKLPLVVVCRPGRGTINHTLLTLLAARYMEIPVAGYLINDMPEDKTPSEETAAHSLAVMTGDELLGILDSVSGTDQRKVELLAEQIMALRTYSLLRPHLPERLPAEPKIS
jgi:dethiobiotin synthetase